MAEYSLETKAQRLHTSNLTTLYFALILWCVAVVVMLILDLPKDEGDLFYKPISAVMLMPIAVYGVLNIWFGLVKSLGMDTIIKTVIAIGFGIIGLRVIAQSPNAMQHFTYAIPGYLGLLCAVWIYHAKFSKKHERETPFSMDASVRGFQSIVMTGNDSFKYVERNNLDNKTPAKKFEDRLLRYLEKKTGKNIFSMAGDGTNYWRMNTIAGEIEFIVIGTGFNTRSTLQEQNRWIIRVQESGPAIFTIWLSKHFPENSTIIRKLHDGNVRAQFVSSALTDDNAFFKADIGDLDIDNALMKLLAAFKDGNLPQAPDAKNSDTSKTVH